MRSKSKSQPFHRAGLLCLIAALVLLAGSGPAALAGQKVFASPEAAMNAFGNAVAKDDEKALKALLGANVRQLIPRAGDAVRDRFLDAWAKSHVIKTEGNARALVAVGDDGWTLPVPLVKSSHGWRFDTRAGAAEIRVRRIGRNERAVMQVMLAICDAQREYASEDRMGDGVLSYATKFDGSPGKHDGLY